MGYIFRTVIRVLLACVLSVVSAAAQVPESDGVQAVEYDVYLLIGQSNMAGRGEMTAEDMKPVDGVWLLNDKAEPEPAANPLNRYSTVRKGVSMQKIGPGYSFSRKVASVTGRPVLLVVNALGGSSVKAWQKDAATITDKASIGYGQLRLFEEAVSRARQARKYGTIRAVIWHQGESDVKEAPQDYMLWLAQLVAHLRLELDMPNLPFIAGELGRWREPWCRFNDMLHSLIAAIPYSGCVMTEGCTPMPDNTHFDRRSQIVLGERYADKVLEIVYDIR